MEDSADVRSAQLHDSALLQSKAHSCFCKHVLDTDCVASVDDDILDGPMDEMENNWPALHLDAEPSRVDNHQVSPYASEATNGVGDTVYITAQQPGPTQGPITCGYLECFGQTFGRVAELRRHERTFHSPSAILLWCPVLKCDRSEAYGTRPYASVRKDKLVEHIRKVHKSDEEKLNWNEWFEMIRHH